MDAQGFAAARRGAGRKLRVRRIARCRDGRRPHADPEPGRGRRSPARGAGRTALRSRCHRACARAGPVASRTQRPRSRHHRAQHLQRHGLWRPPLCHPARGHARKRRGAYPRRYPHSPSRGAHPRPGRGRCRGRHHRLGTGRADRPYPRRSARRSAPTPRRRRIGTGGRRDGRGFPSPQSVAYFGHAGIDRDDPDFFAAFVLNQVLGGNGFGNPA
jgi:hypothetical protein